MSATVTVLVGLTIENPEKVIEAARDWWPVRYGEPWEPLGGRELELAAAFLVAVAVNARDTITAAKGIHVDEPHLDPDRRR